ncbi:MAG: C4-type zinc ribbon domain-containing protein [Dehalococcoidales bacterium]
MSMIIKLLGLQELEIEITGLEKALTDARGKLGESPALQKAKADAAAAETSYRQLSDRQKELEWQSEDIDTKLKNVNEKLYSGRVSNPKELTSLQLEAGLLSEKAAGLDEKALDVMEKTEAADQEFSQAAARLTQAESAWHVEQQGLKQEIDNMQQKIAILEEKRAKSADEISPEALQLYQRVKMQKGVAVARVAHGTCEGCRISLSTAQLQRARSGSLERCANCGRILYGE